MQKLRKSTMIGLLISLGFVIGGVIATGQASSFWNLPSVFIIIGGVVGAVVLTFPPEMLRTLWPVIKRAFKKERNDLREDINALVKLAEIARREGLLALEDCVDDYIDDKFIRKGVMLITDGADHEQLRYELEGATYFMKQRHNKGASMLSMIAATAPALGLLGTYVGLIPMLNSLDDPTTLGPMMALELVSSFYGAFIAFVVFSPLAKRLKNMSKEEETRRELLIEGLVAIQRGKNPKRMKEELLAFANIESDTPMEGEKTYDLRAKEVASQI